MEIEEDFVNRPDTGDRTFLDKLHDQLAPASPGAKQLAAEMLWVLLLFLSNVSKVRKVQIIRTVWMWSGEPLPPHHPMLEVLGQGVGSGGMGYSRYTPAELQLLVRFLLDWKALPADQHRRLANDPWAFAEFLDRIDGADRRQFRHMLLHLLFPDTFERVSSGSAKEAIDAAFAERLPKTTLAPEERGISLVARDRRLLRLRRILEAEHPNMPIDFYEGAIRQQWQGDDASADADAAAAAPNHLYVSPPALKMIAEPSADGSDAPLAVQSGADLEAITSALHQQGLRIDARTIRRYHLALTSRGFVILSGISGTGKTWLAEAYARTVGARGLVVPVAPNWTTNEDLLGFPDPFSQAYRDTQFSRFVRDAADEYAVARRAGTPAREFHLILDEMNLARVEYYFAKFLSAMEQRIRDGEAQLELGPNDRVLLSPNLRFVGTVNVDETTHGFADKVYDRAQLVELVAPREAIALHLGDAPYAGTVLAIWDAVAPVAPFAFRVLDDMRRYVDSASTLGVRWEDLLDELVVQKILPKIRGTDPRIGDALETLATITEGFDLSHAKITAMRSGFEQHGIASYF